MSKFIETEKGNLLNLDHIVSLGKHEREDHAWIEATIIGGVSFHVAFSHNISDGTSRPMPADQAFREAINEAWFMLKQSIDPIDTFLLKKTVVEEKHKKNRENSEDETRT